MNRLFLPGQTVALNGGHVPLSSSLHEPFMKTVLPFLRGDWKRG